MQLERIRNGFQIDAEALGPLLGVRAEDVQRLLREGRIATVYEEGRGEDSGRHRITFRYGSIRVRLTLNERGEVLLRTRTAVAPSPSAADRATPDVPESRRAETTERADESAASLTQEIEKRFHERHRQQLQDLGKLAEMVEDLHEGEEGVPVGLHVALLRLQGVLGPHIQIAEDVVFPAIRSGTASDLAPWIDILQGDHVTLRDDCRRIREVTEDFRLPYGACTSWATLYAGLADFVGDLQDRIRLESQVLVQQVQTSAAGDERAKA